ncbi:hypothetical protein [Aromatoleum diolicum]|uniref:Uncharacterized protein n=1 Tax=Aromatoleum diolicum TaxID=75796 RepID=A0ABX1QD83_9RHOO|nr:hypothetical protein [Aromatoleum diolicum]NMG76373.1 hypothetical protein [Aromatoleum diolicum]
MDIEYLEYELEIIDLPESVVQTRDSLTDDAAAEAIFTKWFTDCRALNTTPSNPIASR